MKNVQVLLFGAVADIVGKNNLVLTEVSTTDDVKEQLEKEHPALKNISYAIAVNKQMITTPTPLKTEATVALLPPFSGG